MGKTNDSTVRQNVEGEKQRPLGPCEVHLLLSCEWTLIGYQGQHLGKIGRCVADFKEGKLLSVEVATPSQSFPIQWNRVEVDATGKTMRLRPERGNGSDK